MKRKSLLLFCLALLPLLLSTGASAAGSKTQFEVAWSVYAGWAPWDYADSSGILRKWAERYGIDIRLRLIDDYATSLKQYGSGKFDACAMTNMDALSIAAEAGVDSTVVVIGDFSNGNDGIVLKGSGSTLASIRGRQVYLVSGSVSHYLLARGLATVALTERDVHIVDTSDSRIASTFASAPAGAAVVTWKPQLSDVLSISNATLVYDSSRLRGEIMDLMVVRTEVLKANPDLALALTGAWYETLAQLQAIGGREMTVKREMAKSLGTDLKGVQEQLSTTQFLKPAEALGLMRSPALERTMDLVREFCFAHGLLGKISTAQSLGIALPGEKVLGDPRRVRLRFDDQPTQLLASGKLRRPSD